MVDGSGRSPSKTQAVPKPLAAPQTATAKCQLRGFAMLQDPGPPTALSRREIQRKPLPCCSCRCSGAQQPATEMEESLGKASCLCFSGSWSRGTSSTGERALRYGSNRKWQVFGKSSFQLFALAQKG